MDDFSGKVAVVTGAGSGIGRGIAKVLARAGVSVAIADIMPVNAASVAAEINAAGGRAVAIGCDVTDRASVKAMKADVNRLLGPVSLLIANAGVTLFEQFTDMSDEDLDWVIDVSLYGVIHCLQGFLPDMIAARSGHVVATASSAALLAPFVGAHAPYAAAKSGIVGLMLSLRRDLEESGVGASVLCPGAVESRIVDSPRYRPGQYGGPRDVTLTLPTAAKREDRSIWRPAEEAGEMVLQGIRRNRAIIVTDGSHRKLFEQGIVRLAAIAFDDVDEFDRQRSSAN